MADYYSSFEPKGTRWLLQRITAVFLVAVLAFHFMLLHFINHAANITADGTAARMTQTGYFLTMVLFLVAGTFHGVNGVYNALVNQGLDGIQKSAVKWLLVVGGVLLVAQGIRVAVTMTGIQSP
jgi:succinate dehydrogenase / fumarate reductase membrane anchor subunit